MTRSNRNEAAALLVTLWLMATALGCIRQPLTTADYFVSEIEAARSAASRGEFVVAREGYRELLARYAKDESLCDQRAQAMRLLARVEHQTGNYSEAESLLLQALDLIERRHGRDDARAGWVASELGPLYQATARLAEAEYFHRRALELLEPALDDGDSHLSVLLNNLGSVLVAQGRHAEAVELLERAHELSAGSEGTHATALVLVNLADTYRQMGRLTEAEQAYRDALASQRVEAGYRANLIAMSCLDGLAEIEADRGELETAGTLLRAAIGVGQRMLEAGEAYRPGMSVYEHTRHELERINERYLEIRALIEGNWV